MKAQIALIGIMITSVAHSTEFGIYANSIAAHNIAATQHTISDRVFFPMANNQPTKNQDIAPQADSQDPERYGEMLYYGEFGDDTGVLPLISGRNGGDTNDNYFRIGWQHFSDDVKFKKYPHMKSTSDVAFIAYGNEFNSTRFEFFGGYSGTDSKNNMLDIDNDGGFIGASFGKRFGNLELSAMADVGFSINDIEPSIYGDDFNNFYAGVMANIAYDQSFDDIVFFRPALRGGYTWINSQDYFTASGEHISNQDIGFFELTPMMDIYSNLGDGLVIGGHVGYIMNFTVGGRTTIDSVAVSKLGTGNYFEYGVAISQSFENFRLGINVGRHDGSRNGWNGGAEFKYAF